MKLNLSSRKIQVAWVVYQRMTAPRYSTKVDIDATLIAKLESEELKPRHHTGIVQIKRPQLPYHISSGIAKAVGDHPVRNLVQDCKKLNQYLTARHPPPEHAQIREKMREIIKEVDEHLLPPPDNLEELSELEQLQYQRRREAAIRRLAGNRIYSWKPIAYGAYESLVYAVGRGPQEYGTLLNIMREIEVRDESFKPRSYFDFGSGVGTGMWAASTLWHNSIFEYFNVDSSRDMHDLSELLLRGGNPNQPLSLKNVYYRQFLPGLDTKYDLVVCAYSLFELPNESTRKEVLRKLWSKCDGYLVIVEEGTRRGSELVNEARDYILSTDHADQQGHVFAPCPHSFPCPRLSNKKDVTPCNFELHYAPHEIMAHKTDKTQTARYSYIVLKRGASTDRTQQWPRLVRPTLVRSKHVICRMCTFEGKLQEIICTKAKHDKFTYRCAKASRWGDRLPLVIRNQSDADEAEIGKETSSRRSDQQEEVVKGTEEIKLPKS